MRKILSFKHGPFLTRLLREAYLASTACLELFCDPERIKTRNPVSFIPCLPYQFSETRSNGLANSWNLNVSNKRFYPGISTVRLNVCETLLFLSGEQSWYVTETSSLGGVGVHAYVRLSMTIPRIDRSEPPQKSFRRTPRFLWCHVDLIYGREMYVSGMWFSG